MWSKYSSFPYNLFDKKQIFKRLYDNGYIYEKIEPQAYCEKCNKFLQDREIQIKCPECGEMLLDKNNKIVCSTCEYEEE